MIDLSKFTSNKKILNKVIANFVAKFYYLKKKFITTPITKKKKKKKKS